ncbi:MAG: hypothetical protein WAU56_07505 [Steroidobacteraceae bacterium]
MTTPDYSKAQVAAWRKEIAGELVEAREELAQLRAADEEASAAARAAEIQHRELEQTLARTFVARPAGFPVETLAAPLAIRLQGHAQELKDAQSRQSRAAMDLKAAHGRIADLELALRQLGRLTDVDVTQESAAA